jgi:PAS domain S-box-containing protein
MARAQEALQESESRLRALSDNVPDGAIYRYRVDVDGTSHVDFISAGIERLTGMPAAEFVRDIANVERNILPEDRDRLRAAIAASREHLTRFEIEVRHTHCVTGETRWSLLRSTPVRCPDGSTTWDGLEIDITEQKRAEEALRESETKLRNFFDSAGVMRGIQELVGGRILHVRCNEAVATMLGVERDSVSGKLAADTGANSKDLELLWIGFYQECLRTGQPFSREYSRRDAKGQERWLHATVCYLGTGSSGNPRFGYTLLDLTERKRVEEALRQSERRERARAAELEALMEATPAAIFIAHDAECRSMTGNPAAHALLQRPAGTNLSKSAPGGEAPQNFRTLKDGVEISPSELPLQKAAASGKPVRNYAFDIVFDDGVTLNVTCDAVPLLDEEGRSCGGVGVMSDVTELQQTVNEVKRLAGELHAVVDAAPVAIWIAHDPQCLRITGNAYADQLVMQTKDGDNVSASAPPGQAAVTYAAFRNGVQLRPEELPNQVAAATGRPVKEEEFALVFPEGRTVHLLLGATPLFDAQARVRGSVTAGVDITWRKEAERALRESEARHRLLSDTMLQGVVHQNADGSIISINPAAERILGKTRDELLGVTSVQIAHDSIREDGSPFPGAEHPAMVALRTGQKLHGVVMGVFNPREGAYRWISIAAVPLFRPGETAPFQVYTVFEDITERNAAEKQRQELLARERTLAVERALRETEAELARVARGLAVGEMATSIAHEVNQPLAGVITNAEAARRWLAMRPPELGEVSDSLDMIVRDGNRAAAIIRRIREFTAKGTPSRVPLDLDEVIRESADFANHDLLKRRVNLRLELGAGLPQVLGDRIQLQQVLLNLIMNGAEAMASNDGPKELTIASQPWSEADGRLSVRVEVRDSGDGIRIEDTRRIFDAFFTTKPGGIGMGLSISRSIVEAHGGRIWAAPNNDRGLTVQFRLPAGSEEPA